MDHSTTTVASDADLPDEEAAEIAAMEERYGVWDTLENDRTERLIREAGFAEF